MVGLEQRGAVSETTEEEKAGEELIWSCYALHLGKSKLVQPLLIKRFLKATLSLNMFLFIAVMAWEVE